MEITLVHKMKIKLVFTAKETEEFINKRKYYNFNEEDYSNSQYINS